MQFNRHQLGIGRGGPRANTVYPSAGTGDRSGRHLTCQAKMKLTTFTDYSLRVLIYLATEPDRHVTIAEIASSFRISENHLVKVVHFLGLGGWLANSRGKGGGLSLAKAPRNIGIGAIVRQTEGADQLAKCFGKPSDPCAIARVCRLRTALAEAADAFYGVLDGYTLADLVKNHDSLGKALFVDQEYVRERSGQLL